MQEIFNNILTTDPVELALAVCVTAVFLFVTFVIVPRMITQSDDRRNKAALSKYFAKGWESLTRDERYEVSYSFINGNGKRFPDEVFQFTVTHQLNALTDATALLQQWVSEGANLGVVTSEDVAMLIINGDWRALKALYQNGFPFTEGQKTTLLDRAPRDLSLLVAEQEPQLRMRTA